MSETNVVLIHRPVAVKYPDSGLRDDAHALSLWDAHMYDTGGEPLFSAEQLATERAAREAERAEFAETFRRQADHAQAAITAKEAAEAELAALRSRCEGLVEVGNELAEHAQHHPDCSLTPNGIDGDCWCGYFGTVERWRELLSAGGET